MLNLMPVLMPSSCKTNCSGTLQFKKLSCQETSLMINHWNSTLFPISSPTSLRPSLRRSLTVAGSAAVGARQEELDETSSQLAGHLPQRHLLARTHRTLHRQRLSVEKVVPVACVGKIRLGYIYHVICSPGSSETTAIENSTDNYQYLPLAR